MNLASELAELERAQLVRRVIEADEAYLFKHALTQETAYQSLLLRTRRDLNRRVADIYERLYAEQLDENAALLAHYFAEAGESEKAIAYLTRAGERAMQISAYMEAVGAFEHALDLLGPGAAGERADLLVRVGEVYHRRSDYSRAKERFEMALALAQSDAEAKNAGTARSRASARTIATALSGLARLAGRQGEHTEARRLGEESLRWARDGDDPAVTAFALRRLGIACNNEGDNERARRYLEESLELFRQIGDIDGVAGCLNSLGIVLREEHDLDTAAAYFQEALNLSQQLGDRYGVSVRLSNLAVIATDRGDFPAAGRYLEEGLALAREIGDPEGVAHFNLNLGGVEIKQDKADVALQYYREALAETMALGAFALALYIVAAIGEVYVRLGQYERGAELLGLAFSHPASTADIKIDMEPTVEILRNMLPAAEFGAAMARGAQMNLNDVVKEILAQAAP